MDENEIPDWVENTPEDTDYNLTMCPPSGSVQQDIFLTREEFIALKAALATMRGYVAPDKTA